ncbi:hypothetical protein EON80_07500 [bacterium]|nr:MAG: hypothetical protein EON80_07500 [bacterium]
MVLPNLAFDALMFGLLLLAAALDSALHITHGTLSLLIVGGATYWAAQELSDSLLRRVGWTQESLATSVAVCSGGFLYFVNRNSSDLALLALSIGLMMGALMVAISILAALSGSFKEGTATPVLGWLAACGSSLALGISAGLLAIVMGLDSTDLLPLKIGGIAVALVLWKVREKVAPPSSNPHFQEAAAQDAAAALPIQPRVALFPQRGTLLDRLFPLLVLGVLLGAISKKEGPTAVNPGPVAPSESGEAH